MIDYNSRRIMLIAGPCAVESWEQIKEVAQVVKEAGIDILRGGAYKPRTSPYSFQGLEKKGLELLNRAGKEFGLKTVTEVVDTEVLEQIMSYVDILQVGTRNMTNFSLLKKMGRLTANTQMPVIFKRGFSATIEEWLLASEYITSAGNSNVILCERGIRTFETATRFTLDLNAIPVVKKLSSHHIIVDTSHATGHSDMVLPMSRAAIAAGADGIMVEVHPNPAKAMSDGAQSITPPQLLELVAALKPVAESVGRKI